MSSPVDLHYPMPSFIQASDRLITYAQRLIDDNPFEPLETVDFLKLNGANLGLGLREHIKIERQLVVGKYFRNTAAFPHTDAPDGLRFISTYTTAARTVGVACDMRVLNPSMFIPDNFSLEQVPENAKNLAQLFESMAKTLGNDWLTRAAGGDADMNRFVEVRNLKTQQAQPASYLHGETVSSMHYSVPRQPDDPEVRLTAVAFHS